MAKSQAQKLYRKYAAEWGMCVFFDGLIDLYGLRGKAITGADGEPLYVELRGEKVMRTKAVLESDERVFAQLMDDKGKWWRDIFEEALRTPPNDAGLLGRAKYQKMIRGASIYSPDICIKVAADLRLTRLIIIKHWWIYISPFFYNYDTFSSSFFPGVMVSTTGRFKAALRGVMAENPGHDSLEAIVRDIDRSQCPFTD